MFIDDKHHKRIYKPFLLYYIMFLIVEVFGIDYFIMTIKHNREKIL